MVKRIHKKIARKRIDFLFDEAAKAAVSNDLKLAKRYALLARKIGMRYNVTLRSRQKRRVCKRCYSYLYPSINCRVRLKDGKLVTPCGECGTINRYVYRER